jgi:hypothetical protein
VFPTVIVTVYLMRKATEIYALYALPSPAFRFLVTAAFRFTRRFTLLESCDPVHELNRHPSKYMAWLYPRTICVVRLIAS